MLNPLKSLTLTGLALALSNEKKQSAKKPVEVKPEVQRLPNGCQLFTFGKVEIVAINKKNALRKYESYCVLHGISCAPKIKSF